MVALLAVTAAGLAGCANRSADVDSGGAAGVGSGGEPRGRTFVSSSVTENGKPRTMPDGTTITLDFTDDGRLIASAGCNTMQGPVRFSAGTLGVSDLAMTAMGCEPSRQEQDSWLSAFLSAAPTVRLDDTTLTLTSKDTEIVLLDREVAQPDVALEGPTWVVHTLLSTDIASSMPADAAPATLVFAAGAVEVSTGCNAGSGTYEVNGKTLTFGEIVLTRKACPPQVMQVEQAITTVLDGDTAFEIDSDRLDIKHPTGAGLQLTANP